MKTLYLTRGSNIVVDTENNTANRLSSERQGIDYIYLADEPMHVVFGFEDEHEEVDVEKGDIIVTFYSDVFKKQMIVVKNEDWLNNLTEYRKQEQEEKERWAKSKKICEDCPKCDECPEA